MHSGPKAWAEEYGAWLKAMPDAPEDVGSWSENEQAEVGQAMMTMGQAAMSLGQHVAQTGYVVLENNPPAARVRALLAVHLWYERGGSE